MVLTYLLENEKDIFINNLKYLVYYFYEIGLQFRCIIFGISKHTI